MVASRWLLMFWLAAIASALAAIEAYQAAPGRAGAAPAQDVAGPPRLLVFLHPRCPCSLATLAELQQLLAEHPDTVRAEVFFVLPEGTAAGFEKGSAWQSAGKLPGVQLHLDAGGRVAARHGAETSGHVLFYSVEGRLHFSGGITPARGTTGESAGRRALADALRGSSDQRMTASVFGCPLVAPGN